MSLLFIPDYSDGNPYQSNLADALDQEVTYGRTGTKFPVLGALWKDDIAVVHFHWLNLFFKGDRWWNTAVQFGLLLVRLLAIRLVNVPVVWTVHNATMHEPNHPRLERQFKRWFIISGTCDRLILHCDAIADTLIEELDLPESTRERMDVIPHGHYLDNYENTATTEEARDRLDIDQSDTVFLFFGLIRRYKGVLNLVECFQTASVPDSTLVIAGNPRSESLHAELLAATDSDDRIRGVYEFIPDDEIQYYMNAADVVVLPFRRVTTSGSAVLAMSFGTALIVSRCGCLPELIPEDGALFYDADDETGLQERLERAIDCDVDAMGASNRRRVSQYDWASIATQTERVYAKAK
ncbi:glycosyltransferase family 4 protein [Halovenus marina]|uniref:glycosyltransferase family 4 protein n=1 Tax=Halovenus marina TaxID=3396621 RepID=UPI003F55E4DA